jgi:hypothetical protein
MFSIRPSIPVLQDTSERLKLLQEVHAWVRPVLPLHTDEMQARSESSTAPHFVRGDKVTIVTKNLFIRAQPNMKLRVRQVGPFDSRGVDRE